MAKKVWILLCAFGLVCSCQKEEDVAVPAPVADSTAPSFVGQKIGSGKLSTRATDDEWSVDDEIGIYMLKKSGDEFNYDLSTAWYKNKKYTFVNATDALNGTLTPATGHTMYYPISGDPVAFVAYYPHKTSADNEPTLNTLTFDFTEQDTQDKKEDLDFVFHRGTKGYNKSNPDVELEFEHKFSKIKITVKPGDGISLKDLVVRLSNMPESATVDLASLALATDETSTTTALGISEEPAEYIIPWVTYNSTTQEATVEAIVAPHPAYTFADRKFIFTTADGAEYTYTLPNDKAFISGEEYKFAFTLHMKRLLHDGLTNSFMVKPKGESKTFTVLRAYARNRLGLTEKLHVDYPAGDKYTGKFGIDVVWEDPLGLIDMTGTTVDGEGHQAMITVKTTADDVKGNAVVRIFKKDDPNKTVWSYHIWVTDYDPDNGGTTWTNTYQTLKTYTFMNCNLGATMDNISLAAVGLLYQWGRKDPFPNGRKGTAGWNALNKFEGMPDAGKTGTYQTESTNSDACIKESIENPTRYYGRKQSDWYRPSRSDLWYVDDDQNNNKTIYDPCPENWRVPAYPKGALDIDAKLTSSPWYGVPTVQSSGTAGSGWKLDNKTYLPPTGRRERSTGKFESQSMGYWWTATSVVNTSHIAHYYTGTTTMSNGGQDAGWGQAVRCVKENP